MSMPTILLSVFFLLGLLFTGLMLVVREKRARLVLLLVGLAVVDLGGLAVLSAAFLAARLDGSSPPGMFEFLAGLWAPVGLLVVINVVLIIVYRVRNKS